MKFDKLIIIYLTMSTCRIPNSIIPIVMFYYRENNEITINIVNINYYYYEYYILYLTDSLLFL